MRKRFRRPSPALIVAVCALVAAAGGTVYAASQIDGKTIKKHSIPGNRMKKNTLTGKQIKEKSLRTVPTAAHADTADRATTAGDADTVNGHVARCPGGTMLFAGSCWETAARGPAEATAAGQACAAAGGELPGALALQAFAVQSGVTLSNTDELSSDLALSGATNEVAFVKANGLIGFTAITDATHKFRCVLPLVR
jgi:hypothetical protein